MKTPPAGTPDSQRATHTGKMRPISAPMATAENPTSQAAKAAGAARPAPPSRSPRAPGVDPALSTGRVAPLNRPRMPLEGTLGKPFSLQHAARGTPAIHLQALVDLLEKHIDEATEGGVMFAQACTVASG